MYLQLLPDRSVRLSRLDAWEVRTFRSLPDLADFNGDAAAEKRMLPSPAVDADMTPELAMDWVEYVVPELRESFASSLQTVMSDMESLHGEFEPNDADPEGTDADGEDEDFDNEEDDEDEDVDDAGEEDSDDEEAQEQEREGEEENHGLCPEDEGDDPDSNTGEQGREAPNQRPFEPKNAQANSARKPHAPPGFDGQSVDSGAFDGAPDFPFKPITPDPGFPGKSKPVSSSSAPSAGGPDDGAEQYGDDSDVGQYGADGDTDGIADGMNGMEEADPTQKAPARKMVWSLTIPPDHVEHWFRAMNQARLVLSAKYKIDSEQLPDLARLLETGSIEYWFQYELFCRLQGWLVAAVLDPES